MEKRRKPYAYFRNKRGHTDTQVYVEAVLQLLCCPFSDPPPLLLRLQLLGRQLCGLSTFACTGSLWRKRLKLDLLRSGGADDTVDVDAWDMDGVR